MTPATATREVKENLDYTWIERLLAKRQAQFSNVLAVLTKDPQRIRQFLAYLRGHSAYGDCSLYRYTPWEGLTVFDPEERRFRPAASTSATTDGSSEYEQLAGLANQADELKDALKQMDGRLKSATTILLLEGLEGEQSAVPVVQAIRSWAHDGAVTARGSMVVLFSGDISRVLDDLTIDQIATFQPPLAEHTERTWQIRRTIGSLGMELGGQENENENENENESESEDEGEHEDEDELEVYVYQLAQATAGLDLHQLEAVLTEAYDRSAEGRITLEAVGELKAEFIKRSQLVEVEEPSWGFESVGGYWAVKRFVEESVLRVLHEHERAARFGVPLPRGLLLFGPPGTGKTLFVKALAKETNLPFINLRTENLFSMWLGESGRKFSEAIRLAEQMSPAIVFIDEIDRFGKRSGTSADGASQETQRVFSQVLEWLGDKRRQSIIVGTTNTPEHLDEAFLRAGRFDYKIPFLYPGKEARREILEIHLGLREGGGVPPLPWGISEEEREQLLEELSERTQDFTGAELEQLALRARRNAFNSGRDKMSPEDLRRALECFRIAAGRSAQKERYLAQAAEFTDDQAFLEQLRREA
jgi:SpoVK/Ycf46/Vps4 family AAA+-type ATPase